MAEPITHLEQTIAGQVEPVTHLEKVIAKYGGGNVYENLEAGANILIEETADGKAKISASGEVSSEDTVARAAIAEMKDGTNIDSFGDVETALAAKANTATTYTKTEVDTALSAKANAADVYSKSDVDTALGGKVDKQTGKGLSTNDYTTAEKTKLAGIAEGAEVNVQSNWTQTTTTADDYIKNKPTLGTAAALDVAASGNASTSQVVKGNDTRLSDARNAADVSAWAKAANKPSYAGSEIPLTGYSEAQSKASVAATDTTNEAIGKLEYRVETNENNFLLTYDHGGQNLAPVNSGSDSGAAAYWFDNPNTIDIPANTSVYIVYDYTITNGQYSVQLTNQYGNSISGTQATTVEGTTTGHIALKVTPNTDAKGYKAYHSSEADVTISNFMIVPADIYEAGFTTYVEKIMTNAEITAWIKAHT